MRDEDLKLPQGEKDELDKELTFSEKVRVADMNKPALALNEGLQRLSESPEKPLTEENLREKRPFKITISYNEGLDALEMKEE